MDELEIERGYADFNRGLNRVLRKRDVKAFKTHIARHPMQAGRLSHCLGLSDELAEIEMYRAILIRSALRDLHQEAAEWLTHKGIELPRPRPGRKGGKHKKLLEKTREVGFLLPL
jgi:hypothetical protein